MNAWPALQTLLYDGWVIRLADGYTKRANSVNPVYFSNLDLDEKLRFCENLYGDRQVDTVFKLTQVVYPPELDGLLEASGYRKDSPTSVQLMELAGMNADPLSDVSLRESLSDDWLQGFCRMSAVSASRSETLQRILLNILPRHGFAAIRVDGRIIACGLGVLQGEYLGLFDIIVDSACRRHGFGRAVVEGLLAWGQQQGARRAYLQVMLNNMAATRLYASLGFTEQYQYWYRIKS